MGLRADLCRNDLNVAPAVKGDLCRGSGGPEVVPTRVPMTLLLVQSVQTVLDPITPLVSPHALNAKQGQSCVTQAVRYNTR